MSDKHNRLDSQFSLVSAFWEPHSPEVVLTGTLSNDDNGLTFTTSPQYGYRIRVASLASLMRLSESGAVPRIAVMHGFSADGICTLCQLLEIAHPGLRDTSSGHWIEANSYRASLLVGGMHLGGLDDKVLTSARFTYTGLGEWLPGPLNETWETDHILLKIPLEERVVFKLGVFQTRVHASLLVHSEILSTEDDGGRITRPVAFVEIESGEPESLNWYLNVGNRVENFFSLLLGSSVAMETMFVYKGEESGHVVAKRKRVVEKLGLFDCVRCTTSQLAHGMATWLSHPEEFRSVENLALGVLRKGDLFYETEFLSLTQALEGFHRVSFEDPSLSKTTLRRIRRAYAQLLAQEQVDQALASRLCESMAHANDPTFASRLIALCSRLSDFILMQLTIDPPAFAAEVAATRNFLTHAGNKVSPRRRRTPVEGAAIFFLNQKLRALLRGVLLLDLGLPEEQIASLIVREGTRWR
ncbi:HEPN domain-containing protein [Granulicella sp. S156]|uniref:HEPN domain-containing protein n=1 Tax=Granulicella sp. S156 TaxID=1747224 RepID=UPI00131CA98D|nr:HEPN domain-containing protein [Granulicella sp. S156]